MAHFLFSQAQHKKCDTLRLFALSGVSHIAYEITYLAAGAQKAERKHKFPSWERARVLAVGYSESVVTLISPGRSSCLVPNCASAAPNLCQGRINHRARHALPKLQTAAQETKLRSVRPPAHEKAAPPFR